MRRKPVRPNRAWQATLLSLALLLLPCVVVGEGAQERVVRLDLETPDPDSSGLLPRRLLSGPAVGIALSGGGARGLAHIGVLKVLHREGIPIHMVAGSSMGSIIGGLLAAGYAPEEIERIALEVDWDTIFEDAPKRTSLFLTQKEARSRRLLRVPLERFNVRLPSAFSTGQRMSDLFSNLTLRANYLANADFDRLPRRFRSVATDLSSGKPVVIGDGDLAEAMRASTGVPLFLTPVQREGAQLADGGILNNIPVNVVRDMGADIVVAVNVTSSLRPPNKLNAIWEIADQVITIMMQDARDRQLEDADLVITPRLAGYSSRDFQSIAELIRAGEVATQEKMAELQALLKAQRSEYSSESVLLSEVAFQGNRRLSDSYVGGLIALRAGQQVHEEQIREALKRLYESGYCSDAYAAVQEQEDGIAVTYHIAENPVLSGIEVVGNTLFDRGQILEAVQSVTGAVLNRHRIRSDIAAITDLYVDEGYVLAQVHTQPFDSTTGVATIVVDEGRIGRVTAQGNRRTREPIILREFPLREGQLFRREQAEEGMSNVYATGLFDRAVLTVKKGSPDAEVIIKVKEKSFVAGELGIHFNKAYRAEALLGVLNENALGLGIRTLLSAMIGETRQLYALEGQVDRVWRTYLTCRLKACYSREDRQVYERGARIGTYQDARVGARFSFGQQVYRWGAETAEMRIENARFEDASGTGFPDGKVRIRSLVLSSIGDSLDRFPFPRTGRRHHLYVESAGKVFEGTESYVKLFALLDSFHTVRRKHTLRWRAAWGTADRTLPSAEAFRLGGGDDIYGYQYGHFGDRNNLYGFAQDELQGRQLLAGAVEYTLWIPRYFYLSLTGQLGNVWAATDNIRLSELHYAWGIRGAFDTPAGPVSLAYGRTDEGTERVYLSAGYEF